MTFHLSTLWFPLLEIGRIRLVPFLLLKPPYSMILCATLHAHEQQLVSGLGLLGPQGSSSFLPGIHIEATGR